MSFLKVYIHFVWTTKNRYPFLKTKEMRKLMWEHIKKNAKEKNIFIDTINGHTNHCHCLVSLGKDQTIQNIMRLLKGESSHWANKNEQMHKLLDKKFGWQDDYFAVSVSKSQIKKVRNYIRNQENHHLRRSFEQEVKDIIQKLGFENHTDGLD